MDNEINAYVEYLLNFNELALPKMPKFNLSAYTEIEYLNAIKTVMQDYENIDDEYLVIEHLKGN